MKPIGTPARHLTPNCIWNSFRNSGKRNLILTGTRNSGKTTLFKQLFPEPLPGLTSWAKPGEAVFLQDNGSHEMVQVGMFDAALPGPENQMVSIPEAFLSFGVPALERYSTSEHPWISIDEVGYLETQCDAYLDALHRLFEKKRVVAVVRKQQLPALAELCAREDTFVVDLDDPFGSIGCVIMASGLGKRFGSNKLMADFAGDPLIHRILDATEGIFPRRVLVTRHEEIAQIGQKRGVPTILHDLPHRSDTVRLGLEALPELERCMFAPADQPLIRPETIVSLCLASVNAPSAIWRTACGETPGSPVIFPRWAFGELLHLPEGSGGGWVMTRHPETVSTMQVENPYELMDADTPQTLELLKTHLF